jgi:hypothetical protein
MTEYLIATSVLEGIVRGSLASEHRVRLHSSLPLVRTHPAEVIVDDEACKVIVHLDVRMGEFLPDLASIVRTKIATSVDVVFSGVFSAGS